MQVPLNSVVSMGTDGTATAKGSDGKMVAMISAARQFVKMPQTAEANEKAAAQLLTANGGRGQRCAAPAASKLPTTLKVA